LAPPGDPQAKGEPAADGCGPRLGRLRGWYRSPSLEQQKPEDI